MDAIASGSPAVAGYEPTLIKRPPLVRAHWTQFWPAEEFPFKAFAPNSFEMIYLDPAWRYLVRSPKGEGRSASRHYRTMPLAQVLALPIEFLAAENCMLFMWIPRAMIHWGIDALLAWGFTFKTVEFVWVKIKGKQQRLFYAGRDVKMGMGHHSRAGSEQCWLATRGKGFGRLSGREPEVIFGPLREHSRKPDEAREAIVRLYGDRPRIELNARQQFPGWSSWGDEREKFG